MAKSKKAKKQTAPQKSAPSPLIKDSYIDALMAHPNWLAFGIFTALIFAFFHQAVFSGMIYFVPDAQMPAALSKPLREALQNDGIHAHWMPYIFGGMPSYASLVYTPFAYFPYIILMGIEYIVSLPPLFAHIIHYPFGALGVFLILRDRKVDFLPALFAGMAFMMMPHLISMEVFGHGSKLMTTIYMPLAFWAVDRLLRRGGWLYLGLAALLLGLQFQRGHVQIVYYTWMLLGAYLLYYLFLQIRAKETQTILPALGKFAAVLILGLGMAAVLYLPIYEYTPYSIRGAAPALAAATSDTGVGFEYATQWSFSFGEMLTFLIPSFYGFGNVTYWGTMPFTDFPHYMGILIFMLALYAVVKRRQELVPFFAVIIVIALLISFGKNFSPVYRFFYAFMPYFNKFRVPVMILIIVQFGFVLLAGLGMQHLYELIRKKPGKHEDSKAATRLYIAAGAVIGLALLVSIAESGFFSFMQGLYPDRYAAATQAQIDQERFSMLMTDWWVVSIFAAGALVLLALALRQKITATVFGVAIVAITLFDMWRVDAKINNPVPNTDMQNYLKPDQLSTFLQQDDSVYRIFPLNVPFAGLNLFGENRWAAQGVQSAGGYSPAKPRVYQDLLDASSIESAYIQKYYFVGQQNGQRALQQVPPERFDAGQQRVHQNLIDLLNVKYLISPYPIPESTIEPVGQFQHIIGNQQVPLGIFENKNVLPRAFLVGGFQQFDDPKVLLSSLTSPEFDPRQQVLLYEAPAIAPAPDSSASAELTSYSLHEITVKTSAAQPQLLVLTDTYYPPGWHATIDGEPAAILQANHAFRAVAVPAGEHEVQYYYASSSFELGFWLTIISSVLVVGLLVLGWRQSRAVENQAGEDA